MGESLTWKRQRSLSYGFADSTEGKRLQSQAIDGVTLWQP
ncbi:MAG: hypothetical protein QOG89_737 [Thermomicrobiales bacterium]|nr:hypothetical protein [Thermomicrobiales bacterium]